jgi:transposase-like protein
MSEKFAVPITQDGEDILRLCRDRVGRVEAYRLALRMGLSMADTARAVGVSRQSVAQWAKYWGYKFRPDFQQCGANFIADMAQEAAKRGLLKSDLANVTGISFSRICAVVRRNGVAIKREPVPAPRAAQIRELAARGLTVSEVARELGIPQSDVSRAKKRWGIEFCRKGRSA